MGLLGGGFATAVQAQGVTSSPIPLPRPADLFKRSLPSGESLVETSGVSGQVAFAVRETTGDAPAEVYNPVMRMPPASVAKTVTALYALETLGAAHRFATRVIRTGPVVEGIVQGDLVLVGGGDPTLDTDALAGLAADVVAAGVRGVTGKFLLDDTALPRVQEITDDQTEYASYNPTITGLNLNYNRVHFEWRRQEGDYSLKMDARAERFAPDVRIARMRIADRNQPVFDHEPGQGYDTWSVARSALGNGGARWLPVRVPALYAGEVFQRVATGLRLPTAERIAAPVAGEEVARHESAPLSVIAQDMLKYSTNLTAEVLGLSASKARGAAVASLWDSASAMNAWARTRFGMRHLAFVDHSGLGGASVVTVSDMIAMLTAEGVEAELAPILKVIPMRDADGNLMKAPLAQIHAKTGTLDFVSTLAGYSESTAGTRVAFAIFAADLDKRQAAKDRGEAVPAGSKTYNSRAKSLQQALLRRWAVVIT